MSELLSVKNLVTSFNMNGAWHDAVKSVSFDIAEGEMVGLVGESGSGKSVTSLSILNLISSSNGRISSGEIFFQGSDLLKQTEREWRKVRGNKISMIFQEPMTSLNPVFKIGDQIAEVLRIHKNLSKKEARHKAIEALERVRIPAPEKRIDEYPHMLSGGMRQRVMIAMALVCKPKLLIADEPTTALDVTVQAQVLKIINELRKETGTSVLLITHDLGVVHDHCDRVMMMYGGEIIESASTPELFEKPSHPYTQGLLSSLPTLGSRKDKLESIQGQVPKLGDFPRYCRFSNRCSFQKERCHQETPSFVELKEKHEAKCFFAQELFKGARHD